MHSDERAEHEVPRYPTSHAFVVQFQDVAANNDGRPGRVEHLSSGRSRRFNDTAQLIEFISVVLATSTRWDGSDAAAK